MFRRFRRFIRRRGRFHRRFKSRRQRSRRIFRKFIRRTAVKPELKWVIANVALGATVSAGSNNSTIAITDRVATGSLVSQRNGAQIKTVKADINLYIQNNSSTTSAFTPNRQSGVYRVILWSPRIDITLATNYMNTVITAQWNLDYTILTVYRDRTFQLAPAYMTGGTAGSVAPVTGGIPYSRVIRFKVKFPRKVNFGNSTINPNGLFDAEKHQMYCTVVAPDLAAVYSIDSKLYFLDA